MFIASGFLIHTSAPGERNISQRSQHVAPPERNNAKDPDGYKHLAPPEPSPLASRAGSYLGNH